MKSILIFSLLLLALSFSAQAEEMHIGPFVLDNPMGPTELKELSSNTYSATWPAGEPYEEAQVELIVTSMSAPAVEKLKASGESVYRTLLSSVLQISSDPQSVNKTLFFGSTSARRVYQGQEPRPHSVNVFSKTLPDGSYVLVAVRVFEDCEIKYGDLIRDIGNTFRRKD